MPVYAVLHQPTRVVRRITTDDPPRLANDELGVVVSEGFETGGGFVAMKAGGTELRAATADEAKQAGVDEEGVAADRKFKHATALERMEAVASSESTDPVIRAMASAFADWLRS